MNWGLNKTKYICAVIAAASLMCACGDEIPEMTPEQTELITDYSAALLLKYDSNTPSRLLPEDQANTILVDLPGQVKQEIEEFNPDMNISDEVTPQVSNEDVTVIDTTDSETSDEVTEGDGFIGLVADRGFDIQYSNYEIADSYPDGSDSSAYFAIDATEGNELLIIHFNVVSTTGSDTDVNMNQISAKYRVSVNGGKTKKVMNTLLANDLLSYVGTVSAEGGEDVVAIAEISKEDAANIQSLQFVIRTEDYNATINLK